MDFAWLAVIGVTVAYPLWKVRQTIRSIAEDLKNYSLKSLVMRQDYLTNGEWISMAIVVMILSVFIFFENMIAKVKKINR